MKVSVKVVTDNTELVKRAIRALAGTEVLVGYPEDKDVKRRGNEPSNAELAYIHNFGAPAANIPPRPFLEPGVEKVQEKIGRQLTKTAEAVFDGSAAGVSQGFNAAGLTAQAGIRNYMTNGDFEGLKASTLAARKRRRFKGTKPLIETGQLRAAVNYVIRRKEP
jgi:hypothetical protein